MTNTVAKLRPLARGFSRFRLRIHLVASGLKPYGWEIYDEEDGRCVRRSSARFRTSAEAWDAGSNFVKDQIRDDY